MSIGSGGFKSSRRGWCLGGETFRQELLAQAHAGAGENQPVQTRRRDSTARKQPRFERLNRRNGSAAVPGCGWRRHLAASPSPGETLGESAGEDACATRFMGSTEEKAGRIMQEELDKPGWTAQDL